MATLNTSICHPTSIQRQYTPSATMYYHRHKQRINIPPETAPPPNNTDGTNRQKSNNFSRRRISSPIYTAARHYRHRLTCKDLPERCIVGYDTTRPQIEAYEGRLWPSFSGSRLRLVVFLCFCGWLSACVPYLAESHDHLHFAKLLCKKLDGRWG